MPQERTQDRPGNALWHSCDSGTVETDEVRMTRYGRPDPDGG
jgi:hypothetical protein